MFTITQSITFTILEGIAVTGLFQSVVILVYMALRVRHWREALVATAYFICLALSFALQFALRLDEYEAGIRDVLWFTRAMLPPLCYLLVMQVVLLNQLPQKKHFLALIFAPVFIGAAFLLNEALLNWLSAMVGTVCMLAIWVRRNMFSSLNRMKGGRERYWLVITLIIANLLGVTVTLLRSIGYLDTPSADIMMSVLGIVFCYLATTTLFRVYPQPVQLDSVPRTTGFSLTPEEKILLERVRKLMELDKLYHEPTFSRADLAREVGTSESILSKVVNTGFGKSFPTLLSTYRVEDAKRMLADSDIPIHVVASEVGFNSLASFNRVFRLLAGETPSAFRTRQHTP